MKRARPLLALLSLGLVALSTSIAYGQAYPNRPIRIITGAPASSNDIVLRFIAQGITASMGQPILVENLGSGVAAGETVAKAAPDGYTMILFPNSLWIAPLLQNAPYDVIRDFTPVSLTSSTPNILFVIPSVPVNSVKELIAYAKARPGELNYASGNTGATSHLAGELFNSLAGVKVVRVPYKSGSQQLVDLLGGRVQMTFSSLDGMQDHIKTGKLKPLGVGSAQPSVLLPGLPTVASTVPGFESLVIHAMWAPAGTPTAIVNRMHQEVARFLNTPEARAKLLSIAIEPVASTPAELGTAVKADIARLTKLIKDANIRVE